MNNPKRTVFITGGAGFIGSNLAWRAIKNGDRVIVFDNLSRKGVDNNLKWLQTQGEVDFIKGDVRQYGELEKAFRENKIDVVFHEAAQVAVTTSVIDPRHDFETNALGTFNVLEAVRNYVPNVALIYASTNKVYGNLEDVEVIEQETRYSFKDDHYKTGVTEERIIDFHSPYGCSKGAAEQYVRDYSRIYDLKTVVFRQSCIYGYRQIGLEDQGWLAWFAIRNILNQPVTVYGDGKQVRDVLFIDDLVNAYFSAVDNIEKTRGHIYNIGGGPENALSLLETFVLLETISGHPMKYSFADWRPGDQKIFIANTQKAKMDLSWWPTTSPKEGLRKLYEWLKSNQSLFS